MAEVVASGGVLLQHYTSHVHWYVTILCLIWDHLLSFVDVMFGDSKAPRAKIWIQESQDIL